MEKYFCPGYFSDILPAGALKDGEKLIKKIYKNNKHLSFDKILRIFQSEGVAGEGIPFRRSFRKKKT